MISVSQFAAVQSYAGNPHENDSEARLGVLVLTHRLSSRAASVATQPILQSAEPKEAVVEQESLEFMRCEATERRLPCQRRLSPSASKSLFASPRLTVKMRQASASPRRLLGAPQGSPPGERRRPMH